MLLGVSETGSATNREGITVFTSVKRIPSAAILSMWGVMPAAAGQFAPRSPYPQSSQKRMTKFGFEAVGEVGESADVGGSGGDA